jgi:hypothetical protein
LLTQALPTALCRLPRGFAVGKAFTDWVYGFTDRGKQSAKRRFPVVTAGFTDSNQALAQMVTHITSGQYDLFIYNVKKVEKQKKGT